MNNILKTKLLIIGSGSAGYMAALKASELNIETILIEKKYNFGGTCLNHGCIPTKALLYLSNYINQTKKIKSIGIKTKINKINFKKIQNWKNNIIKNIKKDIIKIKNSKNIKIINGTGTFLSEKKIKINNEKKFKIIEFENAIIATGSIEKSLKNKFILTSEESLNLRFIPKKILIIGAGFVGLELSTIFSTFGSEIDIIEKSNNFLKNFDEDIKIIYKKHLISQIKNIYFKTRITKIKKIKEKIIATLSNKIEKEYDVIISAIGRRSNIKNLNLKEIGVNLTTANFIKINEKGQTNIKNIYACGDVTGYPMLAHKAFYQAKTIVEIISGNTNILQKKYIPIVLYTYPEIAQVGINEKIAKKNKIRYTVANFTWNKNSKALIMNENHGLTKLVFNEKKIIVGATIIGHNADEIISELALAIEMKCNEKDISLTIHPHPSLSETICFASDLNKKKN